MTEPALLLTSLAIVFFLAAFGIVIRVYSPATTSSDEARRLIMLSLFILGMCLAFCVSSALVYSWPEGAVNAMDCAPWVDLKEEP